jgi:hypothetical protein
MPTIYVDTDNSNPNPQKKLYSGTRAGGAAFKAEEKMQRAVKRIVDKAPDFTTTKFAKAKGYAIRLSVAKVDVANANTKCSLSGEIVRWPPLATGKRGNGETMVSTSMIGNAMATGTGEAAVLDCVEAIAEELATKSLKVMRDDFTKW